MFAVLSTFALVSVAARVIWIAIRQKLSPDSVQPREYVFFNTQLGNYAACLLIANMLTCVSGLIGLRWLSEKGITEGSFARFISLVHNPDLRYRQALHCSG